MVTVQSICGVAYNVPSTEDPETNRSNAVLAPPRTYRATVDMGPE